MDVWAICPEEEGVVGRRHHSDINQSGDAVEGEYQITTVFVCVNESPVTLSVRM